MNTQAQEAGLLAQRKVRFWEQTEYDRAFRGTFGAYMTRVESEALERVFGISRVDQTLDLGCGHGRFLTWLAPRTRCLIGLDRSRRLLEVANEELRRSPLPVPVALLWASATDIPLKESSVERITCVRVIQHVPDQERVLREAWRVLRPDGELILVQYNWASPHGMARAFKAPVKAVLRRLFRVLGREPSFDEPSGWTWWPGLRSQLADAGLKVERMTGAWLFPLQYFRSRQSNDAVGVRWALALERFADRAPWKFLGGYLVVRCRKRG